MHARFVAGTLLVRGPARSVSSCAGAEVRSRRELGALFPAAVADAAKALLLPIGYAPMLLTYEGQYGLLRTVRQSS